MVVSKQKINEEYQYYFSKQAKDLILKSLKSEFEKCRASILFPTCVETLSGFLRCFVEENVQEGIGKEDKLIELVSSIKDADRDKFCEQIAMLSKIVSLKYMSKLFGFIDPLMD